jgi:EmrB/QacA subfamily drug resistance transporter
MLREKRNDDAVRDLWEQLAGLWNRNPELYDLITSGRPLTPEELAGTDSQTRADVGTALQLCDALGGIATRFAGDRSTLFSLWPVEPMWDSLSPIVIDQRSRNPIAYNRFERALRTYQRFAGKLTAEARGESNVVLVTIAVGLAVLIYALDQTIVASALPTIANELQGLAFYGWVFAAYTIAATATTLLYGRLGDLTSRRRLFVIAMTGFLIASIGCGVSGSMLELVGFRALQGLFGGATFPLAIGIIADTYPIERRAQGFAIVPTTFAVASVLGPLLGGFLAQTVGWRFIFFVNIPVVIAAITLLLYTYRPPAVHGRLRLQDLDPPGILTLFGGLVVFLIALETGNSNWDWTSWQEAVLLAAAVIMLGAFVYLERRSPRPLLPLRILKHPGLGGALVSVALLLWITTSILVFIPEYAQVALLTDAQGAGLVLIPMMLTWGLTANIAVRVGQRKGFRNVALWGVFPIILGLIYVQFIQYGYDGWTITPGLALIGLGAGMINPNMLVMAQSSMSDRDQAMAGGLGNVSMSLSAAIAASVLTAVQIARLDGCAGLSSVTNAASLLSPGGRYWYQGLFGPVWTQFLQHCMAFSIHNIFLIGFIPAVLMGLWVWLRVPKTNADLFKMRMPPLRPGPPAQPAPESPEVGAVPQPVGE